jgi:adenine-specific DNA-methyltransferase
MPEHQSTEVAPPRLLKPLEPSVVDKLARRHQDVLRELRGTLGDPYFAEPGFTLYCGDSAQLLPALTATTVRVDLTLTSPPYNIGKEYERHLPVEEYLDWCSRWMTQIFHATAPKGAFWLNLGYFEIPGRGLCVPISYLLWGRSPFYLLQEIIWHYGAGVTTARRFSPRNEKWLFYVRDASSYTFNLDAVRDPNVKYPHQKKNGKYRCNPQGKNPSDVWEIPKVTTGENRSSRERTAHPAQFPLPVVERIIKVSSNLLDLILDPFAGSASSGIAASALGRLFVGIEIREDYCALAVSRYKEFRRVKLELERQASLFPITD